MNVSINKEYFSKTIYDFHMNRASRRIWIYNTTQFDCPYYFEVKLRMSVICKGVFYVTFNVAKPYTFINYDERKW